MSESSLEGTARSTDGPYDAPKGLLKGQTSIVTGSTKGNGRAIAELFSAQGSNVVIIGRNPGEVDTAVREIEEKYGTQPLGLRADIASDEDVESMVRTVVQRYHGRIDILVNNAGYPIRDELWDRPFHEITEKDLKEIMAVDTFGTFRCCVKILPIMMTQRSGVIINIASTPAVAGYDKGAPYTIAKAAVLGITKHIAWEYGPYGIRCNTIAPGTIATANNWDRLTEGERRELVSGIPLRRAGRPEDIAGAALMLASEYSSFINGETIIVDGGEVTL
jgi:3-oxoacyl-[acyl-carrier protein] reductase